MIIYLLAAFVVGILFSICMDCLCAHAGIRAERAERIRRARERDHSAVPSIRGW